MQFLDFVSEGKDPQGVFVAAGGNQLSVVGERHTPHTTFVTTYGLGLLLRQLVTFGFCLRDCLVSSRFLVSEGFDFGNAIAGHLVGSLLFFLRVCQRALGDRL